MLSFQTNKTAIKNLNHRIKVFYGGFKATFFQTNMKLRKKQAQKFSVIKNTIQIRMVTNFLAQQNYKLSFFSLIDSLTEPLSQASSQNRYPQNVTSLMPSRLRIRRSFRGGEKVSHKKETSRTFHFTIDGIPIYESER